jgi:hypothetical protein
VFVSASRQKVGLKRAMSTVVTENSVPESPSALGPDAAPDRPLVASPPHLSSLSPAPPGRYHLR